MITLTDRAQHRLTVLHALDRGQLLMAEAATLVGLTDRQVRRLRRAYRTRGPRALVHGNRGRPSPRRLPDALRARLIRLAQTTYADVNFQHLSEILIEREDLTVSRPTLSRILRAAGIRSPRRRRPPRHRRRRERMPQAGLLVQLDGSNHTWLEHRGPRLVLLAAMDDATSEVLAAEFRDEEDAQGYLRLFRTITQTKGIPVAVDSDRHGIFHRRKQTPLTLAEQLRGGPDPTQVQRVLQELSVRWIPASSPQAKGRIERLFATFQDRLRAELRLAGVRDRAGANAFLVKFLPRYNARFAQAAADPTPVYRPWPTPRDPDTVFCFKYRRAVANDNTVTLGPQQLQIFPGPHGRSYARLVVEVHESQRHARRLPPRPAPARPTAHRTVGGSHPGPPHPSPGTPAGTPSDQPRGGAAERTGLTSNQSSDPNTATLETCSRSPMEALPLLRRKHEDSARRGQNH